MSKGQAGYLITTEMDDVGTILVLKSRNRMNQLSENRRYVTVVF